MTLNRLLRQALSILAIAMIVPISLQAADPVETANDEATSNVELKQKVELLIEQLAADSRSVRIRAEKAMLELGTEILPLLPPPELLQTISTRETVRRIRLKLEGDKARESVASSRVTIKGSLPLSRVFSEIASQTKNRFDTKAIPKQLLEKNITVDFNKRTFWPVMDELVSRTGLDYRFNAAASALTLAASREKPSTQVTYSGAFRIAVQRVQRRPIFGDEKNQLLRLDLQLAVEPRLRPLFLKYAANNLSVQSAKSGGVAFAPLSPEARYEIPLGEGGRFVRVQLDFKIPVDKQPARLSLRGKMSMLTAAGTEKIAFSNIVGVKSVARRRGGVTVMLRKAMFSKTSATEHEAKLRIVVSYDTGGPAFESHRTWIFHNKVYLETKEGKPIELNGGYNTALQADGLVAVEYRFEHLKQNPLDYRFVYEAPTLLINVPIEIEMTNIPLPFIP